MEPRELQFYLLAYLLDIGAKSEDRAGTIRSAIEWIEQGSGHDGTLRSSVLKSFDSLAGQGWIVKRQIAEPGRVRNYYYLTAEGVEEAERRHKDLERRVRLRHRSEEQA